MSEFMDQHQKHKHQNSENYSRHELY
jgi:hypothetical protein